MASMFSKLPRSCAFDGRGNTSARYKSTSPASIIGEGFLAHELSSLVQPTTTFANNKQEAQAGITKTWDAQSLPRMFAHTHTHTEVRQMQGWMAHTNTKERVSSFKAVFGGRWLNAVGNL